MSEIDLPPLRCSSPGDLISTNISNYRLAIERCLATEQPSHPDWKILELDLSQVRFIDSVGINLLVLTIRTLEARSKKMRILISSKNLLRVLTFTRLVEYAEVVLEESGNNS